MADETSPSNPPTTPPLTLKIGTRASALALAQTQLFKSLLAHTHPALATSTHATSTTGDHNQTSSLHTLASASASVGKSLWTHELEAQLLHHNIDLIVHSLKDVPTTLPPGCVVRAVGPRIESRDCVVMAARHSSSSLTAEEGKGRKEGRGPRTLGELNAGSVVGTSSVRRAAMIRRRYLGLAIRDVRGNVGTRLRKLDDGEENEKEKVGGGGGGDGVGGETKHDRYSYDCLVLAGAGVQRLGLEARIGSWLGAEEGMLAAVGQGALGVEFREGDEWTAGLVEGLVVPRVGWECIAERTLLAELEGGCSVPVGVESSWRDHHPPPPPGPALSSHPESSTALSSSTSNPAFQGDSSSHHQHQHQHQQNQPGLLTLHALIVSLDGSSHVEASRSQRVGSDAEAAQCGVALARELMDMGAGRILEGIRGRSAAE